MNLTIYEGFNDFRVPWRVFDHEPHMWFVVLKMGYTLTFLTDSEKHIAAFHKMYEVAEIEIRKER